MMHTTTTLARAAAAAVATLILAACTPGGVNDRTTASDPSGQESATPESSDVATRLEAQGYAVLDDRTANDVVYAVAFDAGSRSFLFATSEGHERRGARGGPSETWNSCESFAVYGDPPDAATMLVVADPTWIVRATFSDRGEVELDLHTAEIDGREVGVWVGPGDLEMYDLRTADGEPSNCVPQFS